MPAKIGAPCRDSLNVLSTEIRFGDATIHLHRAHGRNHHYGIGRNPGLPALDVHKLLSPKVRPKTGFRHHVVGKFQRRLRGNDRVAAMRDIGKRTAMDKGRIVLQRLDKVRLHGLCKQHRHCPVRLDVPAVDWLAVAGVGDNDIAQTALQICQIVGKAEDRHDFRGHSNVKPGLPRETVRHTAERGRDLTKRPVVHVHDPAPDHPARIDAQRISPVDVVVDHRGQQVVRRSDRMEVASEMEVHLLHRHNLRMATTGSPTLHPEAGPEGGLADTDCGLLANRVQPVAKSHGRCRLPLARRCRIDRGDQDQLAIRPIFQRFDETFRDLGLVMTKWQ